MSLLMPHPRTNETGFIGTFPDPPQRGTIKSFTSINVSAITEDIRNALADWEDLNLDDLLPTVPTGRPDTYPADEVAAVEFIADTLHLAAERVLVAVGIKPRTYYGWKEKTRRPRPSSIGSLWAAVESFYYLAESHPNLLAWFNDTPEAQNLFDNGQFEELARLEVDWVTRTYGPAPWLVPYSHLDDIAAGPTTTGDDAPKRTPLNPVPVPTTNLKAQTRRTDD